MSSTTPEPTITLYTSQTPNGIKISMTLEELGLPYKVHKIDMVNSEQKTDWFRSINPNQRIPALTDTHPSDGKPIHIFESGSIMQYLVDRYDTTHKISYPRGTREWIETNNWLFFLNAGIGPMQGQANHFFRYTSSDPIPYAISRYQNETRRLYSVLETHLSTTRNDYLVGNKCTIADIAHWGWVTLARWALGGEPHPASPLDEFPYLKAWEERMLARPGTEKGRQVPDKHQREMLRDPEAMKAFEERGKEFYRKQAEEAKEKEEAGAEEGK